MNSAQILGYPLLPIAALELFLGLLLLKQNARNSPVNKTTAACAFSAALWSLSAALMYLRVSLGLDYLFFARANWIGWFTVPTALQTVLFLKDEHSRKARVAGIVLYPFWTAVLGLCLFTDLIVTDGYVPLPYSNSPGPLEMPFRLIGGLLVFWLIYEIVRLRSRTTGYRRSQLNFYLYGTIIFGTGGAVIGGFVQLFTGHAIEPSLSAYFSFPWVVMIFYAITRYRLFDIRLVISRTLNILFLSFCISAFQFALFKILEPVVGGVASIFISVPIIGVIFFATPLSRNVQQWINDLVLGGRYNYQRMLRESANAMITILQRDELLRFVIESVRSGLGVSDACLYLRGGNGRYAVQYCFGSFQAGQGGSPFLERVIERLASTQQILIQDELASAPAAAEDAALAASMREMDSELIIPLISKGQLLGVVTLGTRGNGESYLQSDIDVLQTLAGHAAVAIENALLFEEAKQVKASLKQSEETFRALAQTLPAAIFIHQGKNFLYANPAAESIAGYRLEDYKTMEFWDIVHPDYRGMVRERAASRLTGMDTPQQYDLKIIRKNGEERWVLMSAGRVEYGGAPAIIGTIFDITDRKRAEEERSKLYEENIRQYQARIEEVKRHQAEKENILKDLHDGIGGLTTNINLLAELAQKGDDLSAIKRSLATISELSRESLSEIRGFIQSLDTKELSWHTIAAELRYLGNTIIEPHGIRFTIDTQVAEREDAPGSAVSMNLFRIYKESLSNIIKHARATAVDVAFIVDGSNRVILDVRDNGIGLDGKRGSGRGLTNMRTRAGEIGGSLSINSEKGTRIRLEFPIP